MEDLHVLVAHHQEEVAQSWSQVISQAGHRVLVSSTGEETLELTRREALDLLIVHTDLPSGGGLEVLEEAKGVRPSILAVLAGPASVGPVLSAFRSGAFDYLEEPVGAERLTEITVGAASRLALGARRKNLAQQLEQERLRVLELEQRLSPEDPFREIVGSSSVLRSLLDTLREVARTDSTVLLTGESGTGKGLLARTIHEASTRRAAPFVEANCVVYSEGVLHSELFGHERGAFTGAARLKRGRFELATGGTLFLDEIGEIAAATQLLLLRVLQGRTFERVGGEETVEADVRLIAATNRDLEEAMRRGSFRSDLFYRLNVIPVHVPPLREHPEDVPVLAQHFLARRAARLNRPVHGFSPDALAALSRHPWPGNIRELENLVERCVVLARGSHIEITDLPPNMRHTTPAAQDGPGTLQDLERRRIEEVLSESGGNKKLAARRLGIHRSTLYAKIERYGLEPAGAAPVPRNEVEEDALVRRP